MGLFDRRVGKDRAGIGSLFGAREAKQGRLFIHLDAEPGYFYETENQDGTLQGHTLFKTRVPRRKEGLELGPRILMVGLFEAHWVLDQGHRVGFNFYSTFQTRNGGGYLLTWLSNAEGKATVVDTVVKTDDLVVLNYPNKGTLVISPKVSPEILSIMEEQ